MITSEQQEAIRNFLVGKHIPAGLGDETEACSIAAINLALTGELTDDIPDCMSEVVGRWIIRIQDTMPDDMRNSDEWRELLPLAAGTGRNREIERLNVVMNWMWEIVLPQFTPIAEIHGFIDQWATMLQQKTREAAYAVAHVARAAAYAATCAAHVATYVDRAAFWKTVDPMAVLRKMVQVQ